jgi:hypothetical protein
MITDTFYFNLFTQKDRMTTAPYHVIASLYGVIEKHDLFKVRVVNSKNSVLKRYADIILTDKNNQPSYVLISKVGL